MVPTRTVALVPISVAAHTNRISERTIRRWIADGRLGARATDDGLHVHPHAVAHLVKGEA